MHRLIRGAGGVLADAVSLLAIAALLAYAACACAALQPHWSARSAWQPLTQQLLEGDIPAAAAAAARSAVLPALLGLAVLLLLWRQLLLERGLRSALRHLGPDAPRVPGRPGAVLAAERAARLVGALRSSRPPSPSGGRSLARSGLLPGDRSAAVLRRWQQRLRHGAWAPVTWFRDTDGRDARVLQDPDSALPAMRVQGELRVPAAYFVDYLTAVHDSDLQRRMDLEPAARELSVVQVLNPQLTVSYARVGLPRPLHYAVADRDAVFEVLRASGGPLTTFVCCASVERADVPPVSGVVRGNVQTFYCVRNNGAETCVIDYAACFDPGGLVPARLLQLFKARAGDYFLRMRHMIEGRYRSNLPPRHGAPPPR